MRLLRLVARRHQIRLHALPALELPVLGPPVGATIVAVPHDGAEFRHRLQGRHPDGAAGEVRPGRCRQGAPDRRMPSASARSRSRNSATPAASRCAFRCSPAARRRRARSSRRRARPSATTTLQPRRDGRAARLGRAGAVRHHRRDPLRSRRHALSLVPLRAGTRASARSSGRCTISCWRSAFSSSRATSSI